MGGQRSSLEYLNAGVPKGSILGPMLFLVYTYDMCNGLESAPHQFADDITLSYRFKDIIHAYFTINNDLINLTNWANTWKVNFNPSKTNFMRIINKKKLNRLPTIYLCDQPIQESESITTLGVTITRDLSWNAHIKHLISKSSKRLLVIRRFKQCLSRKALETLYISMICT